MAHPVRSIRNELADRILEAESRGAPPEEIVEMIGPNRSMMGCVEGDCDQGTQNCGQIGGLIREIKSAGQVVEDVIAEAMAVVESLQRFVELVQ